MNRRDFLLLRKEGEKQIAELSCEKLYMHFVDSHGADKFGANESGISEDAEWWSGEPSVVIATQNQKALFDGIAGDIADADVLLVKGRQWLVEGEFSTLVENLLQQFSIGDKLVKYADQ